MKDEKSKYLIIDSCDIYKEFNSKEKNKCLVSAQAIFENHNVPREYQKIIVKVNNPFLSKYEAEEYTMGFPFDLTAGTVTKENDKKYLTASNPLTCDYAKKGLIKVTFCTEVKYSPFKDVMSILSRIEENNYSKAYLQSIKEFCGASLNIELLDQLYKETNQSFEKTLRLYKK